jgi:uncharacterized protein
MVKDYIIDADSHILEPLDLWENYLEDRQYLPKAPAFPEDDEGNQQFMLDGVVLSRKGGLGVGGRNVRKKWDSSLRAQRWEEQEPGGFSPHPRIADYDEEGVWGGLVFPTIGLRFTAIEDPNLAAALCRAYNKWLADFCAPYSDRLFGIGAIPFQNPELAVREMRYAVEKLGFRGVFVRPNPLQGRNMDHPDFNPVWQAAQDLGCAVAIHEGGNVRGVNQQVGQDRYKNWAYVHAVAHPMEMQMAMMCLLFGGVLERYPGLRVAFVEAGAGWLPFWLERLDSHFHRLGWILPECKRPPSEYFKRQCVIQVESDEATIPMITELVGEDYLVWGSDYPHFDCNWLGAVDKLRSYPLSEAVQRKVLGENVARFYRLPVPAADQARRKSAEPRLAAGAISS